MKSYKARGIVLGTLKYGDKGVIAHILTDVHGRQSYMLQGVKPTSKGSKMALLQPMFAVEFEGLTSSKMTMHRMKDLVSGMVLHSTPYDVRKSTMALFMAEVLYRLVRESETSEGLFDFVWGSVAALDAIDEEEYSILRDISLGSYGAFLLVGIAVLIAIACVAGDGCDCDCGDSCDCCDCDCGSGSGGSQKAKKTKK